jgi:CRP/FNR family cyclic AMP-dependent transcriptional regulator
MSAAPELLDRAATLIEADPSLGPLLGMRETATIGHRVVLPVLSVRAGSWQPPSRARLGAGTVALTVLDGLLTVDGGLLGPGDAFEPWDGGSWTACTSLRLAIIGDAYATALTRWPDATERLRLRSRAPVVVQPDGGALEDRLLDLLWRLALRYGELTSSGVALPRSLDIRALHLILCAAEVDLALALAGLRGRAAIERVEPWWVLAGPAQAQAHDGPHARRDGLLARATLALAIARAGREDTFALGEQLDLELRQGDTLRIGHNWRAPRRRRGAPG